MIALRPDNPLIVQSDRTLLLEVANPAFEQVRDELARFAELVKSPEHIHTYRITPLSLWNASASGVACQDMIETLNTWSKYPVPQNLLQEIEDHGTRYGKLRLVAKGDRLALEMDDRGLFWELENQKSLQGMLAEPYRDYRGAEVLGAWRWLPAYDLAVVSEISAEEAFKPLRYLSISFAVIGGITVLSLVAAFMSSFLLSRLSRQLGRALRLGSYTLERKVSEGGMATIYLARHALLKRPTAIKILKKHVATDEFVHRFEREVQLASQLLHPNTVEIYDFGRTAEGQPYYVMEYLDGVTLAELVQHSGRVPPGRAIHILRQVAAALREAHVQGMVHRDVKPENVMLCRRGEDDVVKLLDFGLVKNLERAETRDITKQLKIVGTPRYMAPERLLNPSDADARSDIYALGVTLHQLLTLYDPALTPMNLPDVRQLNPRVSARTASVIVRATQIDRDRRFQTVLDMKHTLGMS